MPKPQPQPVVVRRGPARIAGGLVRSLVQRTICFCFDWLEADWLEYRHAGNWWQRHVGGWAQMTWFRAHNNRLYRWADAHS